jgi:phosphoglycerate dehydrogenase-like enzyme
VGVDNIDVAAATARRIVVCHTPDEDDSATVAEHAIALMLALVKQLPAWPASHLRGGGWRTSQVFTGRLAGRTVGIVGYGRIGRAVSQRLQGWGVDLLCHDAAPVTPAAGVRHVPLADLLQASDVVSLHCPAAAGGPLLDETALRAMKPGAWLVNTARASLVDGAALARALHEGRLAGAAVDVFHPEPPLPDDPLLHAPNTILTPHVASWTHEGYFRRRRVAAENVLRVLRGQGGAHVVNPEVLP